MTKILLSSIPVSILLRRITAFTITFICSIVCLGQGPYFNWVQQMGTTDGYDRVTLAPDPNENILTAGLFEGSCNFGDSDNEFELEAGPSKDIFISKTSPDNEFISTIQIRSVDPAYGLYLGSMITDPAGNIYITGSYYSTVDFDPDPAEDYLVEEVVDSNNDQDIFVAKYSPEGDFLWVKTVGYHDTDIGRNLIITSTGNLIVTGEFRYSVDFDPGEGTTTLNTNNKGVFIWTLSPDGDFIDAKAIVGDSNSFGVIYTTIDENDNLYLTGRIYGTFDFDPGPATYSVTASGPNVLTYLCKLDNNLSCLWTKLLTLSGSSGAIFDIEVDAEGALFLGGSFWVGIDLDPSAESSFDLVSAGNDDGFVAKLDMNGEFVWGKHFGGTDGDEVPTIEFGNDGNIWVGVNVRSTTMDMDPGAGTQLITTGGGYDLALVELNADGEFNNMIHITGSQLQQVYDILFTSTGLYTGGSFTGTTDFDPGSGVTTMYPNESWDYFLLKLSDTPSTVQNELQDKHAVLYPNPTDGIVNLSLAGAKGRRNVEIYNATGALLDTVQIDHTQSTIDFSHMPAGVYVIKTKDDKGDYIFQSVIRQ